MAAVLTGRSILKFLHVHGGETTLANLASKLNADPAGVDRLIQSLSAAKLVCRTADLLGLSEVGQTWCVKEFKPSSDETTSPPGPVASTSENVHVRPEWLDTASGRERPQMQRKLNRMHGVQVVHTTRRSEASATSAAAAAMSKSSPMGNQDRGPEPPTALVVETAEKAATPIVASTESPRTKPLAPRVVVDREGFVTHIKGRKIF